MKLNEPDAKGTCTIGRFSHEATYCPVQITDHWVYNQQHIIEEYVGQFAGSIVYMALPNLWMQN